MQRLPTPARNRAPAVRVTTDPRARRYVPLCAGITIRHNARSAAQPVTVRADPVHQASRWGVTFQVTLPQQRSR